eukprot:TRINITY_DN1115_c0_g1_i1.p1 TRINITY_DN1115_c0_g1~~TRINITY_DN1115_c0_g1_i1.p1  ORF type:complete len:222 (-),score=52.26 TRINITY_DN1115_c0_g1_i1:65-694(-)
MSSTSPAQTQPIYDVILLGSGICGLSAAEYLSRHSIPTLLIEQFPFFHSQGSSHGDSRIFRLAYPEGFYVDLTKASSIEWENLEKRASLPSGSLLQRSGCLQFGGVTSPQWQSVKKVVKDCGVPHEILTPEEANKRFQQFRFPAKDSLEGEEIEIVFEPSSGTLMIEQFPFFPSQGSSVEHTLREGWTFFKSSLLRKPNVSIQFFCFIH